MENLSKPSSEEKTALKWFNTHFLEKHLQNYFNDKQLSVASFDINSGSGKRDNFASALFRLNVVISNDSNCSSTKILKLIVKTNLEASGCLSQAISDFDIYGKEIEFYRDIAPQIQNSLKKLNENFPLTAIAYGVDTAETVMLLEDLVESGYRLTSVHEGFDVDGAKLVLKRIATFHAITAILQQENPNIFNNFKYGMVTRHTDSYNTFYTTGLEIIIEITSNWPEFTVYTEKLKKLRETLIEKARCTFDIKPQHFNTLIHGDIWINNLMLKFKKKPTELEIEDVILIDFQYTCWNSPANDLQFFFNSSLKESLRPNCFDELIEYYHQQLVTFLKRLTYKKSIPTLEEFKAQFYERSFYGFIASCFEQPAMTSEETEEADMRSLLGVDEKSMNYKRSIYRSPKVQDKLRKLIPIYDRMGLFN
ncbi:uncharacterized protein LOC116344683 [Contarinia nasturtii]|uniref:uncharacterized protein LOC116344683 n=1 Tax=Contarinia nasturtii TaxID=265458 RepID=UPI0012D44CC8|nr:uncharacterized protein LOC116344683 [Contarinia nasturtii]